MAVRSSSEAIDALRTVIDHAAPPEALLREPYLPEGELHAVDATTGGNRWVWSEPPLRKIGGYGDRMSYVEHLSTDPDSPMWQAPDVVFAATATASGVSDADRDRYREHSVDLTMRGGTTSGVVYPLAVCEIARRRRVRNVGGASAGAIAAAATAAAELGRSDLRVDPDAYAPLSARESAAGLVRPGFVGMADTISWLCQLPTVDSKEADKYRLAQLFRPSTKDRSVYAFMTAAMRGQVWAMPLTALLAFGWLYKLLLVLIFLAATMVTAAVGSLLPSWPATDRPAGGPGWFDPPSLAWAGLDLTLFFAVIAAVLVLLPELGKLGANGKARPAWLTQLFTVTSQYRQADRQRSRKGRWFAFGLALAGPSVCAAAGWWDWTAGILVGTGLCTLIAVVVALAAWRYASRASRHHYGLLAGAAPYRKRRKLAEWLAGAAKPTVEYSLVPWLTSCLNRLAALDGQVLRFGHLWLGRDFVPPPVQPLVDADSDAGWWQATASVREASADPRKRRVNLALITTDLARQRPYQFPLPPFGDRDGDSERLFFRLEDLGALQTPEGIVATDEAMFGLDVIKVMADPDGEPLSLHRLPDPWNLPVIFAVRLSLALPGLFKAVRLYRLSQPANVRDDLGRPIALGPETVAAQDEVVKWPQELRVEELWFSDGGITSNFPVHLFDAALPSWPTFGLNLGPHPEGFPHQDVWLPQDWQASRAPATVVHPAMTSFVTSIVDTARSWRDNMQTGMPGSRGRVAWVRQRGDEGGTNLYMPREVIASLALRGALAGARLIRRFDNETQWKRHLWLRLRIALKNFQVLRNAMAVNKSIYEELTRDTEFLKKLHDGYAYDPYSQDITWFPPANEAFWNLAHRILEDFCGAPDSCDAESNVLSEGAPEPHPALSQTPPM
jgi:hypothetical protein